MHLLPLFRREVQLMFEPGALPVLGGGPRKDHARGDARAKGGAEADKYNDLGLIHAFS